MGLGIAKATPKYTPPKVCKKVKKVPSPPWKSVDCPQVPTLTLRVTWPFEHFAIQRDTTRIYRVPQFSPCRWIKTDGFVPGAHGQATLEVIFNTGGPTLDVFIGYTWDPGHDFNYSHRFGDYNSHQTKLLLPSGIEPDASGEAVNIAILLITT
jgi:hypothetical protein